MDSAQGRSGTPAAPRTIGDVSAASAMGLPSPRRARISARLPAASKISMGKKVHLNDAAVVPLADAMVGDVRTALLILLGAVGLLLLVACANVAGLLLARTSTRGTELAVRAALGAGRGRLIQQFLAESLSLSLAGGVLGILLAVWAVRVLPAILPANLPRQEGIAINTSVLLFALAAIVAVAVSLGLFAAWRAPRGDLQEALTAGSRGHSSGGAGPRVRGFLVIGEIATTLVILVGAGLLGRSFLRLIATSPGFRPQNLITMEFSLPIPQGQVAMEQSASVRQVHLIEDILTRLRTIPSAETVALAGAMPVAAGDNLADGTFLILNGQKPLANFTEFDRIAQNPSQTGHASYCIAGEEYFRTLGVPLIRGRMFGKQDDWNSPHVAVISQTLARQRWPQSGPHWSSDQFRQYGRQLEAAHDRWHRWRCSSARPGFSTEPHHLRRLPPARNERRFIAHDPYAQRRTSGTDRFRGARHFPRSRSRCSHQILHLRG